MKTERGAALVELAVSLPVVALMIFGIVDFSRALYTASALTNAARAGAQYAAQQPSFDPDQVKAKAKDASPLIALSDSDVSTPVRKCYCVDDNPGTDPTLPAKMDACSDACAKHVASYITVRVSKTFSSVTNFPGVPKTAVMSREVTMRAQ